MHYINDEARGHVWEECIMKLPKTVQLVMLSASIEHPSKIVEWLDTIKEAPTRWTFLSLTYALVSVVPISCLPSPMLSVHAVTVSRVFQSLFSPISVP